MCYPFLDFMVYIIQIVWFLHQLFIEAGTTFCTKKFIKKISHISNLCWFKVYLLIQKIGNIKLSKERISHVWSGGKTSRAKNHSAPSCWATFSTPRNALRLLQLLTSDRHPWGRDVPREFCRQLCILALYSHHLSYCHERAIFALLIRVSKRNGIKGVFQFFSWPPLFFWFLNSQL